MSKGTGNRALGIVRVSERGGREGESFASPLEQRDRLAAACERDGLQLLEAIEEMDVSGGTPLERRDGLRRAVEAVEAGEADVIVAAYFDRLVRSLKVQAEVIERVEAAGGRVMAVDVGQVTNGSAGQWLSATMLGAVSEYYRRSVKERTGDAQARAVARGVLPYPNVPPGYVRSVIGHNAKGAPIHGPLIPDPVTREIVAGGFAMRASGAIVADVRSYLAAHGIDLSYHGVCHLLASRVVLGEIHFGKHVNTTAHEPIVEVDVWNAVQRIKVPRGRRAKSERLLARLGILRCGTCGSQMVIGAQNRWPFYRCNRVREDCAARVTISADLAETVVVAATRAALADAEGRASAEQNARDAEAEFQRAQDALDAAIRAFAGFEDEAAARERLVELREERDRARDHRDQLGGHRTAVVINGANDWDRLSTDAQRALIRAIVERADVARGRGADRVTVTTFGE